MSDESYSLDMSKLSPSYMSPAKDEVTRALENLLSTVGGTVKITVLPDGTCFLDEVGFRGELEPAALETMKVNCRGQGRNTLEGSSLADVVARYRMRIKAEIEKEVEQQDEYLRARRAVLANVRAL